MSVNLPMCVQRPGLFAALLIILTATPVMAQWEPTARLGLSAAADGYSSAITTEVGQPFTLHIILTGLEDEPGLAFELDSVSWVIHTECCGDSPVGVTQLIYADGMAATGDPYEAVETSTDACPGGDTVLLATATFEWLQEGEDSFLLSAGAVTGALACDDSAHLLRTLTVAVTGVDPSPVEASSWGRIRSLFHGREGGTP